MSDYPRILYHEDGHSAVAQSAHQERTEFGAGWSQTPNDKHRRDPGDGMVRTLAPAVAQSAPPPVPRHQDPVGPVSAGDVRNIIRTEMAAHPGLNLAVEDVATGDDVDELHDKLDAAHAKIDLLMRNLGVELPGDLPEPAPSKRRGRPRKSGNQLTGAAGEQE